MSSPRSKKFGDSVKRRWNKLFNSPSQSQSHLLAPPANTPPRPVSALEMHLSSPSSQVPPHTGDLTIPESSLPIPTIPLVSISSPDLMVANDLSSTPIEDALPDPAKRAATSPNINPLSRLCTALQSLQIGTRMFPPLNLAIGNLIACFKDLEFATRHRRDYEDLILDLTTLSRSLTDYTEKSRTARMSEFIENIALRINEHIEQIELKRDRATGRYLIDANENSDELTAWYRRIGALFRQLQLDINLSALVVLDEQIADHRLEAMTPVRLAAYNSIISIETNRQGCTEGTRVQVLDTLDTWARTMGTPNIYWMNGMAGTGKTTIAYTFAQKLKERKLLGASFFCTRMSAECGNVGRIVPTIAYQLARYSTPFLSSLCRELGNDRDLGSQTITAQFEKLIMKPLLEVKDVVPEGLVIIIDALDECSHQRGTELVLDLLFKHAASLPLKFFVTSRPEPHIRNKIHTKSEDLRSVFVLHEIESSLVQKDIELYLQEELGSMSFERTQIKRLAELSGNLFIYAATAVRYIRADNIFLVSTPPERLATVLDAASESNRKHAEIDDLYTTVLSPALCNKALEKKEKEQMKTILWSVVCACEPLSIGTLSALVGTTHSGKTLAMLQPLYSVLYVSERSMVSTLHASFPDYMLDQNRSLSFYCDKNASNERLSRRCFEIMKQQLRFNICGLSSSFISDMEVQGLKERIKSTLSDSLAYACHYWGNHLQNSNPSRTLLDPLWSFLACRLLFWMEVLNIKRTTVIGISTLTAANVWVIRNSISHQNLPKLIQDCVLFATNFYANPISCSTPHIYISALPLCNKSSSVFQLYWGRTKGLLTIDSPVLKKQGVLSLATSVIGSEIYSLSISPEGTQLAVGCRNGNITLNDAHKGSITSVQIGAHSSAINSLAFSPDGTRFVSGSLGPSLAIWSAQNGTLIASSQSIGYAGVVYSVAFSADGQYIVSGSNDHTIRLWDAYNCAPIANPLREHTHGVNSVAFSPNGQRIIFGSDDHTVQLCSTTDGSNLFEPCKGHTSPVWTVVYSPDGTCVASGSHDGAIRVWDADDGTPLNGPFVKHSGGVQSIAFSPNGLYLVSASTDQNVYIWDFQTGIVLGALVGHTNIVKSLVFSPDGSRIFSGSRDGTIRIWGIPDPKALISPTASQSESKGHSKTISSVQFTSNGDYLASGSYDGTIRVWSARDGAQAVSTNPLIRQHRPVLTLALSPDGAHIAYGFGDGTLEMYNIQDSTRVICHHEGYTQNLTIVYLTQFCLVSSGANDGTMLFWRTTDGEILERLRLHRDRVYGLSVSADGKCIASGSYDMTVCIWRVNQGLLSQKGAIGRIQIVQFLVSSDLIDSRSVAMSPDGTRVAAGSDTISIWDVESGALLHKFSYRLGGGNDPILSLKYSPSGTYIVSGSQSGIVATCDAADGSLKDKPFQGHTNKVTSVAVSPNGRYIASGSSDKTIRIWDIESESIKLSPLNTTAAGSPAEATLGRFVVQNDGWIKNQKSQLLFWIPLDIASELPSPRNPTTILPGGRVHADFSNLFLGEQWARCYMSE